MLSTCRVPRLFLASLLAGGTAMACGKTPDRTPATESAASGEPAATPNDSIMTPDAKSDTTSADSTAAKTPVAAQAAPIKLPKPSIDPGRKPARETRPRPAANPAGDFSASAQTDSTRTGQAAAAPSAPAGAQSQWLKYDAASNTATFELMAGPFNFNGFTNGGATLTLPPKSNVVMNFVNKDGTPHSAEVIPGDGPIPNAGVDPAIPRAYTNKLLEGLPQEGSDVMRFSVPETGTYRIFCGVPGHGLGGMWIWMKVDPAAKAASFGPTKS
jgi:hypothetical protein